MAAVDRYIGVLGKNEIEFALRDGLITIKPFIPENLTNVAYEITLGSSGWFVSSDDASILDISERAAITSSWKLVTEPVCVNGKSGIVIPPKSSVLAHSNEFVGSNAGVPITTLLRARSSLMRSGISVSSSAGWGDIGFTGRWGLLLHNTRERQVFIPFGMRIAQIVFLRVSSASDDTDYKKLSGTYHCDTSAKDFESLNSSWKIESIL